MNPYVIMGLHPSATTEQIKAVYKKLASKHHPDKAGGSKEEMQRINEAYAILSNPERRKAYDETGYRGQAPQERTLEDKAEETLAMHFAMALDGNAHDPLSSVKQNVINQLAQHKNNLTRAKNWVAYLTGKRGKVVRKDSKPNLLEELITQRIQAQEVQIKAMNEYIEITTYALEQLNAYEHKQEPADDIQVV